MNRQLGVSDYSRQCSYNYDCETAPILNSRAISEESGKSVKPVTIKLHQRQPKKKSQQTSPWIQITDIRDKIAVIDSKIWIRKKQPRSGETSASLAVEEFYSVEPASGFKLITRLHSTATGKLRKYFVISSLSLTNEKSTTFFLTLMDPGVLRAFDLVKNQIMDELQLPMGLFSEDSEEGKLNLTGYQDMDVFDHCRKIFAIGSIKKMTKVVILLDYPPWKQVGMVHIKIPAQITISGGVCFILQGNSLQITTWPLLMKQVKKVAVPRNQSSDGLPFIRYEGDLIQRPEILTSVNVSREFCGLLLDADSIPMFFGAVESGVKFYTFHDKPEVVFESNLADAEDPLQVFEFRRPSRVLTCSLFGGESQLAQLKCEWDDNKRENVVKASTLNASDFFERSRQNATNTCTSDILIEERRPNRACARKSSLADLCSNKSVILGVSYCDGMELIAVLTADEEEFQVVIYDAVKLGMLKALPPVRAWPCKKESVNGKRVDIQSVDFVFVPEFIFVSFQYSSGQQQREVFVLRLLAERDQPSFL